MDDLWRFFFAISAAVRGEKTNSFLVKVLCYPCPTWLRGLGSDTRWTGLNLRASQKLFASYISMLVALRTLETAEGVPLFESQRGSSCLTTIENCVEAVNQRFFTLLLLLVAAGWRSSV